VLLEVALEGAEDLVEELGLERGGGVGLGVGARRQQRRVDAEDLHEATLDAVEVVTEARHLLAAEDVLDLDADVVDQQAEVRRQGEVHVVAEGVKLLGAGSHGGRPSPRSMMPSLARMSGEYRRSAMASWEASSFSSWMSVRRPRRRIGVPWSSQVSLLATCLSRTLEIGMCSFG
jgi:hypothetical protein